MGNAARSSFGGAYLGRRRVVELMGEASRERPKGDQLFPLARQRFRIRQTEEEPVQQMHGHRKPRLQDIRKVLGRQLEQTGASHRSQARGIDLVGGSTRESPRRARVRPRLAGSRQDNIAAIELLDQLDLTLEEDVEEICLAALLIDVVAGAIGFDRSVLGQPVQLLVGKALEEKRTAQLFLDLVQGRVHSNSR